MYHVTSDPRSTAGLMLLKNNEQTIRKEGKEIIMIEKLKKILGKVMPDLDVSEITADTRLHEDLGFDSLAIMLFSMEIENEFGFKFKEFVQFETVADVCTYIENHAK